MSYNYCGIHQQNGVASSSSSRNNKNDCRRAVVCPKPRRVGLLGHQIEVSDARVQSELLDIILSKGGPGQVAERLTTQVAASPPFFSGSPPSRVSNPVIQDARFREEKQLIPPFSPMTPSPILVTPGSSASPNSSVRKGGCLRVNFGNNPAVRVEGFTCLDRDSRNCSIPALA